MKLRINNRTGINLLFVFLATLVFIRYGLAINISTNVILAVAILIITFGNTNEVIAMCICCIPLYTSFDYLIVLLYGSIVLLIKNHIKIKIDLMFLMFLAIFIWELFHGFIGVFSVKEFGEFVIPYIVLLTIYSYSSSKLDYDFIGMMFMRFVILTGINLFLRNIDLKGGNIVYAIQQMGRLGFVANNSTVIGGQINPNSLGIMCVLAITFLIQSYFYHKKELKKIVYILITMVLGFLTLSKTYIVLLIIMFCLFIMGKEGQKGRSISVVIAILILSCIFLTKVFPAVVETFIGRWFVEDISTRRISIMFEAYECIWSNPKIFLYGIGLQSYSEKVMKLLAVAPHDFINEILMIWGIPGFIMFSLFVFSIVFCAKKRNKNMKIVNFIPLIIIIAKAIAGHWITSGYTMLAMSLVYLSLAHDFMESKILTNNVLCRKNVQI